MLFFDLDQTLLATKEINEGIFASVHKDLEISMDPGDFQKLVRTVLRKHMIRHFDFVTNQSVGIDPLDYLLLEEGYEKDHLDLFKEDVFKDLKEVFKDLDQEAFFQAFQGHKKDYVKPMDGMVDLLKRLRNQGYKLGLITNGIVEIQEAKIQGLGLRDLCHEVFISGTFGYGKPDPRIYQEILQTLDLEPGQALMVGDNIQADIFGALAQGMEAIYFSDTPVPYTFNWARTAQEVEALIKKLYKK